MGGSDDEEDSDEDEDSSGDDDEYEQQLAQMSSRDREDFLVQSAQARIERARAQGRTDVRLNKHEIAALERHRQREEKEKKKRAAERKKKKDSRVAVPLTQLEPASRKKKAPPASRQPRYTSSGSQLGDDQDHRPGHPPMGYFSPPNASRSQARSSTSSSRPASRVRGERGGNPYDYASGPSRHVSDPMAGPMQPDEIWEADGPPGGTDPFQFQTAGPRAPTMGSPASAAARRHTLGPSEVAYMSRRRAGGPLTRSKGSNMDEETESEEDSDEDDEEDTSSDERDTSSDNTGNRMRTRAQSRGRAAVVVEVDREPEPKSHSSKKNPPKNTSPAKRKSARGGRRRK